MLDEEQRALLDGEQLVAEQHVSLQQRQMLNVRISQHAVENFWRVQVSHTHPTTARGTMSTTVGGGDNFLMNLIEEAVSGRQAAWNHLAQWGHDYLTRPASRSNPRPSDLEPGPAALESAAPDTGPHRNRRTGNRPHQKPATLGTGRTWSWLACVRPLGETDPDDFYRHRSRQPDQRS